MSMKDMNLAKLTSVDLPLFTAIIQDLFPAVDTPTIQYGKVLARLLQFVLPPCADSSVLTHGVLHSAFITQ